MKVYISLPISSRPEHEAREHADRVKAALSRAGHTPVNPFENFVGKDAQYINKPMIFKSCKFEDFSPRKGFVCREYFNN